MVEFRDVTEERAQEKLRVARIEALTREIFWNKTTITNTGRTISVSDNGKKLFKINYIDGILECCDPMAMKNSENFVRDYEERGLGEIKEAVFDYSD